MTEPDQTETMQPAESKPAEATENSAATTTAHPLARELYDWSSRLTAEAGGSEEYYWTPEIEWLVTKLKLTKRALVGVVGVQGAGKSATMRAIRDQLKNEFPDSTVAVKVPESGGLVNALRSVFDYGGGPYREEFLLLIKEKIVNELKRKQVFMDRARRLARRTGNSEMSLEISQLSAVRTHQEAETVPSWLQDLVPHRVVRELEATALHLLIQQQRVILIDMPDYPKHDRRLIARDLDDIQGLWNRLMIHPDVTSDANIVVFIQKETFNYADHFLYGKMTIVDLIPLTTGQLLEAYKQRWGGYAPFTEDALQYIARMSRGIFRRFKRYIALTLEMSSQPPLDLELVKKAVTDEEVMRDMHNELDSIFRKPEQKQKALELIKLLSYMRLEREAAKAAGAKRLSEFISDGESLPDGFNQAELAGKLDLSEMAVSRLVRELEQHGYIKRTTWQQWNYVDMNW